VGKGGKFDYCNSKRKLRQQLYELLTVPGWDPSRRKWKRWGREMVFKLISGLLTLLCRHMQHTLLPTSWQDQSLT